MSLAEYVWVGIVVACIVLWGVAGIMSAIWKDRPECKPPEPVEQYRSAQRLSTGGVPFGERYAYWTKVLWPERR